MHSSLTSYYPLVGVFLLHVWAEPLTASVFLLPPVIRQLEYKTRFHTLELPPDSFFSLPMLSTRPPFFLCILPFRGPGRRVFFSDYFPLVMVRLPLSLPGRVKASFVFSHSSFVRNPVFFSSFLALADVPCGCPMASLPPFSQKLFFLVFFPHSYSFGGFSWPSGGVWIP